MGKNRGVQAELYREMGEDGAFAPKLPRRAVRKAPVSPMPDLMREACLRFANGETLTAVCADAHMPTRQGVRHTND